jgi:class 3 adenylate cyclase
VQAIPKTQYAKTDDGVFLAYQAFGDGPAAFVGAPPIFSNIEVLWENAEAAHWLRSMASFCRFVHYDKRGQGMSDRVDEVPTLERRAADMRTVMDAAGIERATVGGISEGGVTAAMFAATYPDRTSGLLLFGAFARILQDHDYPSGMDDTLYQLVREAWVSAWGTPDTLTLRLVAPDRVGDQAFVDFITRFERQSSTPRGLDAQLDWARTIDVRAILSVIEVPTLVMHRTGDSLVPIMHGRWLASHLPNATFVELDGNEHVPYFGECRELLGHMEELITGHRGHSRVDRALATVVFTDIVASTELVERLGDHRWHALLDQHEARAIRTVDRFGGRVVKTTGDGLLATFDGPARGVRCARELIHEAAQIDIVVRAGAHTGEVEIRGDDVAGIAVHIAARVAAVAHAGEVMVSRTVKDLVAGSGIVFEDCGDHELKGVADHWQLLRVLDSETTVP